MRIEQTQQTKSGSALALSLILLSMLSLAFLALLSLTLSQIEIVFSTRYSLASFYAADSATEQALYRVLLDNNFAPFSGTLSNGAAFTATPQILLNEIVIKAVGEFRDTKRAIETTMETD